MAYNWWLTCDNRHVSHWLDNLKKWSDNNLNLSFCNNKTINRCVTHQLSQVIGLKTNLLIAYLIVYSHSVISLFGNTNNKTINRCVTHQLSQVIRLITNLLIIYSHSVISSLMLEKLSVQDSGVWKCLAHTIYGNKSLAVNIVVIPYDAVICPDVVTHTNRGK